MGLRLHVSDIQIGRVVGETDEGITLFVPKDLEGTFHLEGGEEFYSILFIKRDEASGARIWIPWKEK